MATTRATRGCWFIATALKAAVALVDTNGDEANIDGDQLHYEDGQWWAGCSSGPVGVEIGSYRWGEGGRLAAEGDDYADYLRYAYGRVESAGRHTVTMREWGRDVEVVAAAGGWWAWVEAVDPPPGQGRCGLLRSGRSGCRWPGWLWRRRRRAGP